MNSFSDEISTALSRHPSPKIDWDDIVGSRVRYNEYLEHIRARAQGSWGGVEVSEILIPSPDDGYEIPARIYRSTAREDNPPALVYLHGGGFALGDLEWEEERCKALAEVGQCAVVAVDYRLAPEGPFPMPVNDSYSALVWVAANAHEIGIDPRRLAVGGCSAGGALGAAAAHICRDRGGPALALQVLIHPALDATLSEPSQRAFLDREQFRSVERMWATYLAGAPRSSVYASPANAEDFAGLPTAYIVAAGRDPYRDEAITYARRLLAADVSVALNVVPELPHAFELVAPNAEVSQVAIRNQALTVGRLLREVQAGLV